MPGNSADRVHAQDPQLLELALKYHAPPCSKHRFTTSVSFPICRNPSIIEVYQTAGAVSVSSVVVEAIKNISKASFFRIADSPQITSRERTTTCNEENVLQKSASCKMKELWTEVVVLAVMHKTFMYRTVAPYFVWLVLEDARLLPQTSLVLTVEKSSRRTRSELISRTSHKCHRRA